jgi:hypothetical protein
MMDDMQKNEDEEEVSNIANILEALLREYILTLK